jgi:phosphoserine aminotransferase
LNRIFNFSAGPAVLPEPVLAQASQGVIELNNCGMSVLELSHRGKHYEAVHFAARDRLLKLLGLSSDEYDCLFLGGGASLQFAMLPMNFLTHGRTADYLDTGTWSVKAIQEAQKIGAVNIAASCGNGVYNYIPTTMSLTQDAAYVHITTNNTIEGTQYSRVPAVGNVPLVADASSDILGIARDHSRFDMIYAGAQKNLGPAGVTVVVIRRSFLQTADGEVPTILSYKTHAKNDSLYNTPPAFAVYVLGLALQWLEEQGGVEKMDARNRAKAAVIYEALDAYPDVYEPAVTHPEDRSLMNITFRLRDTTREKEFLAGAEAENMDGLKGHRSVGGFRASIYNAFPEAGCEALAQYLRSFAENLPRN